MIENCLAKLVRNGRISQKSADDALALHQGMQARLYPHMGPASAEASGALEAARAIAAAAQERKLQLAKQAIRFSEVQARMDGHSKGKVAGLYGAMVRDIFEDAKPGLEKINVESHSEAVLKDLLRRAFALADSYKSTAAGLRQDTVGIRNVVRELFGRDTGDQTAKEAAAAFGDAAKAGLDRFKREGGVVSELEDWRLPQFWDRNRLRQFKPQEFVNDLMSEYEAGRMRVMDKANYGPAPQAAVPGIIANAFKEIIEDTGGAGGGGFTNRMRVFRFDDPEAYLRMMDKYGSGKGGLYDMMLGHLGGMSKEIAWTEVFGPKYEANFRALLDEAKRWDRGQRADIGVKPVSVAKAKSVANKIVSMPIRIMNSPQAIERTFDYMTGRLSAIDNAAIAGFFGSIRSFGTAAKLGSAIISAIPGDSVTAFLAANHNGIPATAVLTRMVTEMAGDQDLAAQMNVVSHGIMDAALGNKRFSDELLGKNLAGRLAETVIRAQGLQAWTEMLKRSFSMEFLGMVARESSNSFDALAETNKPFQDFLSRYGFSPEEWDTLRAGPHLEVEGAKFFDTAGASDRRLADRLMSAVLDERQFAVIEPGARIKQITTGGLQAGTFWGEVSRSTAMFKSFAFTIIATHATRAFLQQGVMNKARYAVNFLVLSTIAGAASQQAKAIINGKDPMDMSDPEFWGASFAQGGGLGIYGDLLYTGHTKGGQGLMATIAGPLIGEAVTLGGMVLSGKGTYGEDVRPGREFARFLQRWTPGSTLYYTKLGTDRLIFEQLQRLLDPKADGAFKRLEKRMKKEYGQSFWWSPGQTGPKRGPALGAATGG